MTIVLLYCINNKLNNALFYYNKAGQRRCFLCWKGIIRSGAPIAEGTLEAGLILAVNIVSAGVHVAYVGLYFLKAVIRFAGIVWRMK